MADNNNEAPQNGVVRAEEGKKINFEELTTVQDFLDHMDQEMKAQFDQLSPRIQEYLKSNLETLRTYMERDEFRAILLEELERYPDLNENDVDLLASASRDEITHEENGRPLSNDPDLRPQIQLDEKEVVLRNDSLLELRKDIYETRSEEHIAYIYEKLKEITQSIILPGPDGVKHEEVNLEVFAKAKERSTGTEDIRLLEEVELDAKKKRDELGLLAQYADEHVLELSNKLKEIQGQLKLDRSPSESDLTVEYNYLTGYISPLQDLFILQSAISPEHEVKDL